MAARKPAAMETVGFTVWRLRAAFEDREPAEKERSGEAERS